LQIAWSLLPRLVRSCAIVDQRRVLFGTASGAHS
jgi:hypothetical protein